ncbi:MAG: 50S ribosomal protein L37ae [Hadesarchaea archaeon]|nr:50S ribosomal protein L37ae [Hadesarchaea archaeon]
MGRTKKVGPAGRFGPRYGTKVRKLIAEIERKQRQAHKCPSCGAVGVKRVSTAIWQCRRCGVKFASGAYVPSPAAMAQAGGPSEVEREGGRSV